MIRVRILGSGLIPRGGGLAPRKEPMLVDFNYLSILMNTRSLKVLYQDPVSNDFHEMTIYNFKKIYDKISPITEMKLQEEKAAKVAQSKTREIEVKKEEVKPVIEEVAIKQQTFSKKDKYFKKNRFEQRQKIEEVKEEVIPEIKVEEKTE